MQEIDFKSFIITTGYIFVFVLAIGFTLWIFPSKQHNVIEGEYFIVDEINQQYKKATYTIKHRQSKGSWNYNITVIDSINKYNLGDTIFFLPKKLNK